LSFFAFPEDARWNPDSEAVEFTVSIGEYQGTVRIGRFVFRRFLGKSVSPEACVESYHLHRTRIEQAVEAKLRRKELAEDGNLDLTSRDLARVGEQT
jgi:hypothetical protein